MKIFKAFLASLTLFTLSACGTFQTLVGVSASELDTANTALAASALQIGLTAELATDLLEANLITAQQAISVRDALQPALDAIKVAQRAVAENGDPSQAGTAIETASRSLEIALRLLTSITANNSISFERKITHATCNRGNYKWCINTHSFVYGQ